MAVDLDWPDEFIPEVPLVEGFKVDVDTGLIRTPMEDGQARQRRRFQNPPSKTPASWLMTEDELSFFKSWIANAAGFGAAWFNIKLDMGDGIREFEARFAGKPSYTPALPKWHVKIDLEVRDTPILSDEVLDVIISFGSVDGAQEAAAYLNGGNQIKPVIEQWHEFYPIPDPGFPYFDNP